MKNGTKMVLVGTVTLATGFFIGFKACQATILSMVRDKEYLENRILPILEEQIGKQKLERMVKIYYEKEIIK